jgi:hypothetical protein
MPLSADDELAVMNLIANYAMSIDAADTDRWVANFLPTATLESVGGNATGHTELRAWMQKRLDGGKVGASPPRMVHFTTLPSVKGEGNRCSAQTYVTLFEYDDAGKIKASLVGRYADTCVKLDGRWYFERRVINGELGR